MLNPTQLTIDACTLCQLKCHSCPVTTKAYENNVRKGYLKFGDLKKLLDTNRQIRTIEFDNTGELFLNPDLLLILEYLYKKGIESSCGGVNLNYAPTEMLEGLAKYKLRSITCSIDGATPETYKKYRVGGDFDKVIENIKTINDFKKAYNTPFPSLTWQFIVFGHNEHEIPLAKKMAKDLNMGFYCKMQWDSNFSPIKNKEFVMKETGWPAVTREDFEKITGVNYIRPVCYSLWRSPRINWDGRLLGCCWNLWSEFGGNVFYDGYLPSINSERIAYAKQMLFGKVEPRPDIPCSICEIYLNLVESRKYLTIDEIFKSESWRFRISKFLNETYGFRWIKALYNWL